MGWIDKASFRITRYGNMDFTGQTFLEELNQEASVVLGRSGINARQLPEPQMGGGLDIGVLVKILAMLNQASMKISRLLRLRAESDAEEFLPTFKIYLTREPRIGEQYDYDPSPGLLTSQLLSIAWFLSCTLKNKHPSCRFVLETFVEYSDYKYGISMNLKRNQLTKADIGYLIKFIKPVELKYSAHEEVRYDESTLIKHEIQLYDNKSVLKKNISMYYFKLDTISNLSSRKRGVRKVNLPKGMIKMGIFPRDATS